MEEFSPRQCAGCHQAVPKREHFKCANCKAPYDLECANVSMKCYKLMTKENREKWKCPECISKTPKGGNLTTPIRSAVYTGNEPTELCNITHRVKPTQSSASRGSKAKADNDDGSPIQQEETMLFWKEIKAFRIEMTNLREAVSELTNAVKTQISRIDHMETRLDALEIQNAGTHGADNKFLEATITQLKIEIQDRDQDLLANDVEIAGLPEAANENPSHVTLLVARKLGLEIEERDIVRANRAGPARAMVEGGEPPRPRPLVVRLARRAQRDALLQAARVRRGVTAEGMGLPGAVRRFYVNERLTRHNRQLFQKARDVVVRANWKYIWTRDGKIFVRREHGTAKHRIRSDMDISNIFNVDNISSNIVLGK